MGAGGCTLQQTLTTEAASVLKHSLSLARRRGHAQVTPLHVASTLLSTSSRFNLFRRACLKSQSSFDLHQPSLLTIPPFLLHHQSRALELCFNVALNRLPTLPVVPTAAGGGPPLLHHGHPSFSNALIAALKRAQAHQRRGCIEQGQQQQQQQQQPVLAIKVELEQLILSILDDPSVSRVMREAGFSSTVVKTNLEEYCSSASSSVFQCYSTTNSSVATGCSGGGGFGGIYSTPNSPRCSPPPPPLHGGGGGDYFLTRPPPPPHKFNNKEDIKLLEEVLLQQNKKRKNIVIVGDSLSITENLVSEFMSKVESGDDDVPEGLKSVKVIKFHQFLEVSLKLMKRDEVENKVSELKRKVENLVSAGKGVIIYMGNLKYWTTAIDDDDDDDNGDQLGYSPLSSSSSPLLSSSCCYSPVDHLIEEIGKMVSIYNGNSSSSEIIRFWLLATANYQTYMRCRRMREKKKKQQQQPALDIQWCLQAVSVPSAGGLGLSLNNSRVHDHTSLPTVPALSEIKHGGGGGTIIPETKKTPLTGKLPEEEQEQEEEQEYFLFSCCPECTSNYEKELSSSSMSVLKNHDSTSNEVLLPHWLNLTPTNGSQKEEYSIQLKIKWSKLCQSLHRRNQKGDQMNNGKNYSYNNSSPHQYWWPSYNRSCFSEMEPISFASNANLKPDYNQSVTSSVPRFRRQQSCHIEFNFSTNDGKNLNALINNGGVEDSKEAKITLALGSSLLSGDNVNGIVQQEQVQDSGEISELLKENVPWQSKNIHGISKVLKELKTTNKDIWLLFRGNDSIGKQKLALGIADKVFGSTDLFLDINIRKTGQYREILENALRNHDRLVVFLENIEFADSEFMKFLEDLWRNGKIEASNKNEKNHHPIKVIFILSKFLDFTTNCSHGKRDSVIEMKLVVDETRPPFSNSDHKRKFEWDDYTGKTKNSKKDYNQDKNNGAKKKTIINNSNILDLNMKAEEEENEQGIKELCSIITTDITITRNHPGLGFLDLIENQFLLNRESTTVDNYIQDMILSKMEGSFENVFGSKNKNCFSVEGYVLEKMIRGYGSFLNKLFEKWLKDIFEKSLSKIGRIEEKVSIKLLCLGNNNGGMKIDRKEKGFMGSCLPKNVEVISFLN